MRIAIITPSRMKPSTLAGKSGQYFLEHAVESANSQELDRPATIHFFVGTDPETEIPARLAAHPQITFVRGERKGQIPALNAAIRAVDESWDFVGFLEDDDHWLPPYLGFALRTWTASISSPRPRSRRTRPARSSGSTTSRRRRAG